MSLLEKVTINKALTVKELRILCEKQQWDFAEIINCPIDTYRKKERGVTRFYQDEVELLSRATGIPITLITTLKGGGSSGS